MNDLLATVNAALSALAQRAERAEAVVRGSTTPPDDDAIAAHLATGGSYVVTMDGSPHILRNTMMTQALATYQRDHHLFAPRWLALAADGSVAV